LMEGRQIQGYIGISRDFIRAGNPDKMYYQKLVDWVNHNQGVPDEFFRWLGKTYKLTAAERKGIMDAYSRDVWGPRKPTQKP
jgi:hypothetical protein